MAKICYMNHHMLYLQQQTTKNNKPMTKTSETTLQFVEWVALNLEIERIAASDNNSSTNINNK